MGVDKAKFRADYPEFASAVTFPDTAVDYWLSIAGLMLNVSRWSTLLDLGTELFVAHNIVLEAMAQKTVAVGGLPGMSKGVINSESPGAVSVSYDTSSALELNGSHWNLTVFGTRFLHLARQIGAGPVHVGAGCNDAGSLSSGAWAGPPTGPGWL
jgi:hypothetical protein